MSKLSLPSKEPAENKPKPGSNNQIKISRTRLFNGLTGKRVHVQKGQYTYVGVIAGYRSGFLVLTNATITGPNESFHVTEVLIDQNLNHICLFDEES